MQEKARFYFCELVKLIDSKDFKMQKLSAIIETLKNQVLESISLKMLSHIIYSFPKEELEPFSQSAVLSELQFKYGIMEIIIRSLINCRKTIENQDTYMNRFMEYIIIIKMLYKLSPDVKVVNALWNELAISPRIASECLIMCKWVQELVN